MARQEVSQMKMKLLKYTAAVVVIVTAPVWIALWAIWNLIEVVKYNLFGE